MVGQYIWITARYSPALGDMKSGWAAAGGKGAPLPAAAQQGLSQGHREGTKKEKGAPVCPLITLVDTVNLACVNANNFIMSHVSRE